MPRGRRSSSGSPSSRSSRSKSRGPSRSKSRVPSRSQSRAPPISRHPSSAGAEKDHPSPSSGGPDLKNSLLFLGTIAAAAFTAHKVWPKGVLYGHKDDWEAEHERREHEGKASSCRKTSHHQPQPQRQQQQPRGRDRPRDRSRDRSPPRPRDIEIAKPRWEAPLPEPRRSATTIVPVAASAPQPQQQRKYLPYEPGVYTPSSVASSASARAFEHQRRRERPVLLPIEGPRGQPHLPFAPMAPSAVSGRRGANVFEDEGYASRESVPAARSFAPARYQEGERGEYWR